MTYKAKIVSVDKVRHQAKGTNFLEVVVDIIDAEGNVVQTQRHGMDPKFGKREVLAEVQKIVDCFSTDAKQAVVQKELDKEDENVKELQDEVVGVEVSSDADVDSGDSDSDDDDDSSDDSSEDDDK